MNYMIGIDLGGTTMTAGLVDEEYKIIAKLTWPTSLPRPAADLEQGLADLCKELCKKNKAAWKDVKWVGIGTPGSVNSKEGSVAFNVNFGYYDWQLGTNLSKLLNVPVYVENDANAAAYGEYIAGGAKGTRDAVVITLGTGIGSGIIIDGKIYAGSNYAGAEMGHIVTVKGGRLCNCGRRGCWEKYGSARALAEDTTEAMMANPDNIMWSMVDGDIRKVGAKTAFDAMETGDELAKKVVENWIDHVATGIVDTVNIFQPQVVVIGGGVSAQGETLIAPIRKIVDAEEINRTGTGRPEIKAATLGNDAGVLGAAALGTQHI